MHCIRYLILIFSVYQLTIVIDGQSLSKVRQLIQSLADEHRTGNRPLPTRDELQTMIYSLAREENPSKTLVDVEEGDVSMVHKMLHDTINGTVGSDDIELGRLWPKAIVPYEIEHSYPSLARRFLRRGMNFIMDNTCVKFVPRTKENNYLYVGYNSLNSYSV